MIMKEEGWHQARLAREMGVQTTWVSRVVTGQRDTPVGNAIALLGRVGYELVIRRKIDEVEVKRREFIASVATATFVPASNGNPYSNPEYVMLLSDRVEMGLYGSGGISTLEESARHLRRVRDSVADTKDVRLLGAASQLARQVSRVQYDARKLPQAQESGKISAILARQAKDDSGQSDALNELSSFYSYGQDGYHGERWARQALSVPGISPWQEAQGFVSLGRALGLLREKRHSYAALEKAQEIGSELPEFERARLTGNVGVAFYDQGDWGKSIAAFQEAVRLIIPTSPLLGANYMARQVQAALNAGLPYVAAELMNTLSCVAPLVSSARLDGYLGEIMALSSPYREVPEVRIMRQQLRTLLT